MRHLMLAVFALAAIGCGSDPEASNNGSSDDAAQSKTTPAEASTAVLSLEGPSGTVALGDELEAAQAAFPAPSSAMFFDRAKNLAILKIDSWSWVNEADNSGFEVGLEDGKVIALIRTQLIGNVTDDDLAAQRTIHGNPTAEAVSENVAMLVWASGENARFYLAMGTEVPMFGGGSFTVIGPKDKLKLLNYHYDNPQLYVDQIEAMMDMELPGS